MSPAAHRQSRVENAFFRYTSIIGDGLRARSPARQGSEVVLGCEILDDRPRPTSVVSHRQVRILSVGIVRARDDSCNNAAHRRRGIRAPAPRTEPARGETVPGRPRTQAVRTDNQLLSRRRPTAATPGAPGARRSHRPRGRLWAFMNNAG